MISLKAPAKINWFLRITGKRDDGYHEVRTLMQKITVFDTVELAPAGGIELDSGMGIPTEDNLAYRAALLMKMRYGVPEGARIKLRKAIPSGAGLGGGSSDAACVLSGLNLLWNLNLTVEELAGLASELGSDVPFFLYGPAAFAHGRGEKILPVDQVRSEHLLLVKPPVEVSTAWAYGNYQATADGRAPEEAELTKIVAKLNNIEFFTGDLTGIFLNDLESVTIERFPEIAEIKRRLLNRGAVFALMSGSGPTVFGVFRDEEQADRAAGEFKDCWTSTASTVTE